MAPTPHPPSFWEELRGRRVIRAVALYAVAAWVVVQVADTFFPALRLPEWSVTLVAALAVLGFPITVTLAWLFDRTPHGLKRAPSVTEGGASVPGRESSMGGRRLVLAAALGAVLGLGLVGAGFWWGRAGPSAESAGRPSVAVLPFADFSPEGDQGYLADGITEDILSRLAHSDDMRVLSRTTVMAYRDRDVPLSQIVSELEVTHVLEGSVQRAGDQIKITVQLIDASDAHLWSESWTGPLGDVFAMQDEIADGVANALAVELGPTDARSRGTSREAYELHLRAREAERRRYASIDEALAIFAEALRLNERAIALDPGYAPAWAGAAEHAILLVGPDSAISLAREAIRLDPSSDRGHAVLGQALAAQERYDAASEQFRVATSLNPNSPDAWFGLGASIDASARDPAEAWRALLRGAELGQPSSFSGAVAALALPFFLQNLGFFDEAAAFFRWVEELRGQPGELQCFLAETDYLGRDSAAAVRHLEEMATLTGPGSFGRWCDGRLRFLLGDREEGLAVMRAAVADEDHAYPRVWVGLMEASAAGPPAPSAHGRIADAFAELSRERGFSPSGQHKLQVLAAATAGDVPQTVAGLRAYTGRFGPESSWRGELAALAPDVVTEPDVAAILDENERRLAELSPMVAADLEAAHLPGTIRRFLREERAASASAENGDPGSP